MWSVDTWKTIFDWASIVFVSFTVFSGAGALITGKIIGDRQDEKIAELTTRSTEAQRDAEKFKLELEKIKTPRTISSEQRGRIIEVIRQVPKTRFDVSANTDPEAINFAAQIEEMLLAAGWEEVDVTGLINMKRQGHKAFGIALNMGLSIEFSQSKSAEYLHPADLLVGMLRNEGFVLEGKSITDGSSPENALHVIVGRKP